MEKTYRLPVVVTREDDFGEFKFVAEGTGDFWDIKSKEHDNLDDCLNDIQRRIKSELERKADTWGEPEIEEVDESDIELDDDQKIKYIEVTIEIEDDEDEEDEEEEDW